MEKELADLVLTYSQVRKNIDTNFVNQVLDILIKYYNVEEYIKLRKRHYFNKKEMASYNHFTKKIIVNYGLIKNTIKNFINKLYPFLKESPTFPYILFIQVLAHEIEHAYQVKEAKETTSLLGLITESEIGFIDDLEKRNETGALSMKEVCSLTNEHLSLRKKLYEFSPRERIAEINSNELATKVALMLNATDTALVMRHRYLGVYLSGYNFGRIQDKSDEPTKYYLDAICDNYYWDEIEELSTGLSTIERLKYGFKVEEEDFMIVCKPFMSSTLELKNKSIK